MICDSDDDDCVRADVLIAAAASDPELKFKFGRAQGDEQAGRGRADPCQLHPGAAVVDLCPGMGDIVPPGTGIVGRRPESKDPTRFDDLVGSRIGDGKKARAARIVLQPQTVQ